MRTQITLENFQDIYNLSYNRVLSYIICKCSNIEDVNDLIQETYIELYKTLKRKQELDLENYTNYIIGIAKKRIQRHYGLLYKISSYSIYVQADDGEFEIEIPSDTDMEDDIITKLDGEEIWNYLKEKDIKVFKVFYLYYNQKLKIAQIAKELQMSESNVKNILYRTIDDIRKKIKIEGDVDA